MSTVESAPVTAASGISSISVTSQGSAVTVYAYTTGNGNVSIGCNAGNIANTGFHNFAAGCLALKSNTSGSNNHAQGYSALTNNTTGSNNFAQGYKALSKVCGNNNTAIGYQAGYTSQTANAIAIGSYAGSTQTAASIILNATGVALNDGGKAGFIVSPVRNDTGNISNVTFYNTSTKEFTYSNTVSVKNIGQTVTNNFNTNVSSPLSLSFDITTSTNQFISDDMNANLTISYTGTITPGFRRVHAIRNVTSNTLYITLPNANNNKANASVSVAANATCFLTFTPFDTTSGNVAVQVVN